MAMRKPITWTSAVMSQNRNSPWPVDGIRTPSGRLLAHVLLLVAAEEALAVGLGSWATGQLLVEAHNLLHADGIGRGADGL
jgi:hypothetical protein